MATETRKVLGQAALAATSLTAVYTVPAATQAVISSVTLCNRDAAPAKIRLSVAVAGAGDDSSQYLYYDLPLEGNDTFVATLGIALAATDVVRAYADTANVTVNVFGVQIA